MILLLSHALAAESPGPALLPNSTNATDKVEAGLGVAGLAVRSNAICDDGTEAGSGCGPAMGFTVGPTISATYAPDPHIGLHVGGALSTDGFAGAMADVRIDAVAHPNVHVGPWVLAGLAQGQGLVAGGLAVEAGWRVVRFDTSMPVVAIVDDELISAPELLLFSEVGVSVAIGEHHALRVGMASLAPGIGWRSQFGRVFVETRVHSMGTVTAGNLAVGASF